MVRAGDDLQRISEQHTLAQAVQHVENLGQANHKIEIAAHQADQ